MGVLVQGGKFKFPTWLHKENLVIRTLETNTGARIRIPKMWLTANSGSPVNYPGRVVYGEPRKYMQMKDRGDVFYEEDYYDGCSYARERPLPRRMPIGIPHEARIYPGRSSAQLIDCGLLQHRQFWRYHPLGKSVLPDPDEVFGCKPLYILEGAYNEVPQPYVYLTREQIWDMPTYNFFPMVWYFKPWTDVTKDLGDWFIPVMPTICLYPHDSFSQFDDADTSSMPFGWEGSCHTR